MEFSLKGLVGSVFSLVRSFTTPQLPSFSKNDERIVVEAVKPVEEQSLIMNPTQANFQNELKIRTEDFDRYQMAETMKDLEKAVYHLSASVTYLQEQGKKNEQLLVFLSTTHEELLNAIAEGQSMNPDFVNNTDEEDETILGKAWGIKKGQSLN
jgi:dsDNA-binding SOS-regulon protein